MNKYITRFLIGLLLPFGLLSCSPRAGAPQPEDSGALLKVTVDAPSLRSIELDGETQISFEWEDRYLLKPCYSQDGKVIPGELAAPDDYSWGNASFTFRTPPGIDPKRPFDLYGIVADLVTVEDGRILVGVGAHTMHKLSPDNPNSITAAPAYFALKEITAGKSDLRASMQHLGCIGLINVTNSSDRTLKTIGAAIVPADPAQPFYLPQILPFAGDQETPCIDLMNLESPHVMVMTDVRYPAFEIASGETAPVGFWMRPRAAGAIPEVRVVLYDEENRSEYLSTNTRPEREQPLEAGRAYRLNAEWDGAELRIL